jgi:[histone H3]-lysine9 N-trimethyltransferase SUV39H
MDDDHVKDDVYEPPGNSPYITWRSIRCAARERVPKFLKAQDLPHTLQDYLNALPEMYRASDQARIIFEAAIRESTAEDEPDAPAIRICNEIDDEITPAWEFHYTNKMWHGEGVPGPDLKTLRGCDCEGRCNPKSKTCLCVKKQSKYLDISRVGFVYDHRGRLVEPLINYPIFECNDFCGCSADCQNRVRVLMCSLGSYSVLILQVVQLGRKCQVNIVKTKEKGWGTLLALKMDESIT